MEILRQYATAATVLFPLIERGSQDFRTSGITFAAADTQISLNEGAFADTDSVPAHEGNGVYSLALTSGELTAARISIKCVDAATKLWEDQGIIIQTFGHASGGLGFPLQQTITSVDLFRVDGSTVARAGLAIWAQNFLVGTVDTTAFTPTVTEFESDDIVTAEADTFIGRTILATSDTNEHATARVVDYVLTGGRGHFTTLPFSNGLAIGDNDTFVVLGVDSSPTASIN